ncbi:Upc2 protein [Dactylonectria estremocensis]|uniref:Upc2 protein n=1 Tax=Dactylonectria estremocensis TaxID=1079267 RepID=A0A9P9ESK5_9HYPO|nr:Upc2 protein [Dactylonectria estremocensis]
MPRRSHRKSRNGCFECKKRHIRCDETHPECSHLFRDERVCTFTKSLFLPEVHFPTRSKESEIQTANPNAGPAFSSLHMTLLHHAETLMGEYMGLQGQINLIIDVAIDNSITAPYLLDQLLTLSALHLSATNITSSFPLYQYQATELQTRGLGLFNRAKDGTSDSNYMPAFVFASLIGIHILRETLSNHKYNLDAFIDAFVRYALLHRGFRAITNEFWGIILDSNLEPLLYIRDLGDHADKQDPRTETDNLHALFTSLESESASIQACQAALKCVIDVGVHAFFGVLHERQQEALVFFAYYAAILHRYRQVWVFEDFGSSLVHLVSSSLGSLWQNRLSWPVQVFNET